jgi:type I restriction enzyme S subunit
MTGPFPIPVNWQWASFADVARVESNLVSPSRYPALPHIAPNHIESRTGRILPYVTVAEDGVTSPKHLFKPGHILYSKIRPYLAKAVYVNFEGLCSADMYPIEAFINSRYLFWWLLTPSFTESTARHQSRVVLPKINKEALGKLPVPVPPLAEQDRIVAALEYNLSHLDAATKSIISASRGMRGLWQSVLNSIAMPSSDGMSGELRFRSIAEVAQVQGGIQKQAKRRPVNNAFPFLRVANVTRGKLDLSDVHKVELFGSEIERYRLEYGDLLVVEGNGSPEQIGRAAMWRNEIPNCVHQNHLIRIRPGPEVDSRYLEYVWNSPDTAQRLRSLASSTSGLLTLSTAKVKSIKIPIPPRSTQEELVGQAKRWRSHLDGVERSVEDGYRRARFLRNSILAEAFVGRLAEQSPADEPAWKLLERIRAERVAPGLPPRGRRGMTKATSLTEALP